MNPRGGTPIAGDVVDMIMDDHREVERVLEILRNDPHQPRPMMPVVAARRWFRGFPGRRGSDRVA